MPATLAAVVALLTTSACPPPAFERTRQVAGVFSEHGTPLIVEMAWMSEDPEAPWFNDNTATDWVATLVATDDDLSARVELASIPEPYSGGGTLGLGALSWHEGSGRAVALTQGEPLLLLTEGLSESPVRSLWPSLSRRAAVFGDEAAEAVSALDASIAPDGQTAASFMLLAYEGPGGFFDLRFDVAVYFFDTADGAALGHSPVLPLDNRVDPALLPPSPLVHRPRMLWATEGDAVFVLNASEAVRVAIDAPDAPTEVEQVPALALATRSLAVDDDGRVLQPPAEQDDAGLVTLGNASSWVPFAGVERVPLSTIEYAIALPD